MPPEVDCQLLTSDADPAVWRRVAKLHCQQITGGFLTSLGPQFVSRLYRSLVASPEVFLIAAQVDSEIVGFICGSVDTRRAYRDSLPRLCWSLPIVLTKLASFASIKRVWETLRYPSRQTAVELPAAEILNFCVAGSCQGRGIGRRLFAELETEFRRRGVESIRIVTGGQQRQAQRFYAAVGASLAGTIEVHRGSPSLVYTHTISPEAPRLADAA